MATDGDWITQCVHTQWNVTHLSKEGHSDTGYNKDEPGDIIPSDISQSQKGKHCMTPLHEVPRVVQFIATERKMVVTRDLGEGKWGVSVTETERCTLGR